MFYTYILKSLSTGKHYFGHTNDMSSRLKSHNNGKVKFTKPLRPWILIYQETFPTRSEAYRREMFFKSKEGKEWLKSNGIIST